jgi:hypothetical protein
VDRVSRSRRDICSAPRAERRLHLSRTLNFRGPLCFVVFEVKGGLNGRARGLQGDQTWGADRFATSRIALAAGGKGQWASAPRSTQEFAEFVQQQMVDRQYGGYVIQHHHMRSPSVGVQWKQWR